MRISAKARKVSTVALSAAVISAGSLSLAAPAMAGQSSPVTLKLIMWSNPPTVAAIKKIDADFHKAYPNITVVEQDVPNPTTTYAQLQQSRISANDVDIMAAQTFTGGVPSWAPHAQKPMWQQWLDSGLFLKLNGQSFLKHYYPDALKNASTYKGGIYAVETGAVAYNGVFYNKDIFKKYGLTPPSTWKQLIAICKTLSKNNVTPLVMGGKDGWPQGLVGLGVWSSLFPNSAAEVQKVWRGKAKFTDPKIVKVYNRVSQLWGYSKPGWTGIGYSQAEALFEAGQAAMTPDGSWANTAIMTANPKLNYGYFPIPNDKPGGVNYSAGKYDLQWMVPSKSPNRDAALKWLAFFSQPKEYSIYANATGFIPTQPNIKLDIPGEAQKTIVKLSKHFVLGLDQVIPVRKGIASGQPGDFLAWDQLQPEGKFTGAGLAQASQKAFQSTAKLNK